MISELLDKAITGERLSAEDALRVYKNAKLIELGDAAHRIRLRKRPPDMVTYIVDRNINYTNICKTDCAFCAFHAAPESADGYVLSKEEIARKIEETLKLGGTQILLQGGHNPNLKIEFYEELFRFIKANYKIHLHALSPPEIVHISRNSDISVEKTLENLIGAGLDSIPGGGAEILVDRVRKIISPSKITSDEWLSVMKIAHRLGLKTTATMMFGTVETAEERIEHLIKLRNLQDKTGGFTAFIPWAFQEPNTRVKAGDTSSYAYLKTLALARILLDNFKNIQASWVTMGHQIGQVALHFGANDFGSLMIEENVVRAAGVKFSITVDEMEHIIRSAGFLPKRRNMRYEVLN